MGVALGPSLGQVYLLNSTVLRGCHLFNPFTEDCQPTGQQPRCLESCGSLPNNLTWSSLSQPSPTPCSLSTSFAAWSSPSPACWLPSSPRSWRCWVKAGPCCWPQLAWRTPGRATTPSSPFSLSILPPPSSSTDQELASRTFQN